MIHTSVLCCMQVQTYMWSFVLCCACRFVPHVCVCVCVCTSTCVCVMRAFPELSGCAQPRLHARCAQFGVSSMEALGCGSVHQLLRISDTLQGAAHSSSTAACVVGACALVCGLEGGQAETCLAAAGHGDLRTLAHAALASAPLLADLACWCALFCGALFCGALFWGALLGGGALFGGCSQAYSQLWCT